MELEQRLCWQGQRRNKALLLGLVEERSATNPGTLGLDLAEWAVIRRRNHFAEAGYGVVG